MKNQITNTGNFGYEMHKNGHFWRTYIYKMDTDSNYILINVVRTLIKPDISQILENMDQAITIHEHDFCLSTATAEMAYTNGRKHYSF